MKKHEQQLDERINGHEGYGLISVFTGDGRGKTTASLGTVVRALGAGKRVAIVYFDKGGESHYSERAILDDLAKRYPLEYYVTGRDRIDFKTGRFDFSVTDEDRLEATRGLKTVSELFEKNTLDLLVLDEINSSVSLGLVGESEVMTLLDSKPEELEMILTGRNAPESLKQEAHLVTEMTLQKHHFYSGIKAREGIDY